MTLGKVLSLVNIVSPLCATIHILSDHSKAKMRLQCRDLLNYMLHTHVAVNLYWLCTHSSLHAWALFFHGEPSLCSETTYMHYEVYQWINQHFVVTRFSSSCSHVLLWWDNLACFDAFEYTDLVFKYLTSRDVYLGMPLIQNGGSSLMY